MYKTANLKVTLMIFGFWGLNSYCFLMAKLPIKLSLYQNDISTMHIAYNVGIQ